LGRRARRLRRDVHCVEEHLIGKSALSTRSRWTWEVDTGMIDVMDAGWIRPELRP
jgi:hypothetical protein